MASRMLRRSGVAVGMIAERLGWKPDTIIQVGAGMRFGEMDVLVEEWDIPFHSIVGFEANPYVFDSIYSEYPGILIKLALSDCEKDACLKFKRRHKSGSSLKEMAEWDTEVVVRTSTLDRIFDNKPLSDDVLLWLDCEGSEFDVLEGGSEVLSHVKMVNVEMTANPKGDDWCSPESVHEWLAAYGFYQSWIHTTRSSAGQFDAIYSCRELFQPKYCCNVHEIKRWKEENE